MSETNAERFRRLRPLAPLILKDGTLRRRIAEGQSDKQCLALPMSSSDSARIGGKARKKQMDARGHIFHMFRRAAR